MTYKLNPAFREFLLCLDFVMKWEGGYSDYPSDYGGVTYKGITQASYRTYCDRTGKINKPVASLTEIDVVEFYWFDRYLSIKCDKFPYPLSLIIFDNAVLFSPSASLSFVNEYIYKDPEDYSFKGVELLLIKVKKGLSPKEAALAICDCREKEHRRVVNKDSSQEVFLSGWMNRLNNLRELIRQHKDRHKHICPYKTKTLPPS